MRLTLIMFIILASAAHRGRCEEPASPWKTDFRHQTLAGRPRIEARYTDAARTGFDIDTERCRMLIDLTSETGQRVRSMSVNGPKGSAETLAGRGIYFRLTEATGKHYSSLNAREPSRVNIYRRGPYYIETRWLDVSLCDSDGKPAPIKGEVVFYSYPEKTHVAVILHVTGPIEVKSAAAVLDFDAETCASMADYETRDAVRANDFCLVKRKNDAPSCALIYPVPRGIDDVTLEKTDGLIRVSNFVYSDEAHDGAAAKWAAGDKPTAYFELFPLDAGEVTPEMEAEVLPLLASNIQAASGQVIGYDPIRGCYKVRTETKGGFSYHYEHPNDYEIAEFSIRNSRLPRKIYVMHETQTFPGSVECGVVLDEAGNTLPITVQISKNFSGEKEEPFYNPDDTPFSETFFPLYLAEGETRKLTSLHLYQNWGTHPLKQFSSLGAWMDYYHMSTGVTETTCYVPFLFAGLEGVSIADLRPMSQRMWDSQPQHDNVAGHSFLRYRDDKGLWHYIEYVGTTFRSTGPNWADMSLDFLSDDGAAKVRLDVFELPQTDELRNFIHMRIDFTCDVKIKDGDLARNLRLVNIASWVQQLRYTRVAYGGPEGEPKVVPIKLNDDFTIAGERIPAQGGFAAVFPEQRGANSYVIRRFEGKIDGKPVSSGVSLSGKKNGDTILMLVPVTDAKEIKAGDFLDIDLFIMPYGGGTEDEKPAQKAARDYAVNAPKVTSVKTGRKLADFATRIDLDDKGRAEFTVIGGLNYIPIIIEGAKDYSSLRLYNADGEKKPIEHARSGEKDGYQTFVREDGTFGYVFLVSTDGGEHRYVAE